LSCKGRTLRDGIDDVHGLGLNAMEVQMVRVNVNERFPDEEEVGLTPLEVDGDAIIMEIVRTKGKKEVRINSPRERIKEDDSLITLDSGLAHNFIELNQLGEMSREMDVQLSMHTPYYMDLTSGTALTERCLDTIRWAGTMTDQMGGVMVVTHLGMYGKGGKKQAQAAIERNLSDIMAWWKDSKLKPLLGFELSGRQEVFGSLEEVLELCDRIEGTAPVINFAHVHARTDGGLRDPADFGELLDKVRSQVGGHFYTHFSGVEHEGGNEKRLTPIKKGDLKFEPLAEYLADESPDITVISSSPLLEHDAMYMKVIYERVLTKKVAHDSKGRKDEKVEDEEEMDIDIPDSDDLQAVRDSSKEKALVRPPKPPAAKAKPKAEKPKEKAEPEEAEEPKPVKAKPKAETKPKAEPKPKAEAKKEEPKKEEAKPAKPTAKPVAKKPASSAPPKTADRPAAKPQAPPKKNAVPSKKK